MKNTLVIFGRFCFYDFTDKLHIRVPKSSRAMVLRVYFSVVKKSVSVRKLLQLGEWFQVLA